MFVKFVYDALVVMVEVDDDDDVVLSMFCLWDVREGGVSFRFLLFSHSPPEVVLFIH